ncbi:hypothetical protein GCM10027291_19210 [Telluribacter humicola]
MNDLAPILTAYENYVELSKDGSRTTLDGAFIHPLIDAELLDSDLLNSGDIKITRISENDNNQRKALYRLVEEDGWKWSELGKQTEVKSKSNYPSV